MPFNNMEGAVTQNAEEKVCVGLSFMCRLGHLLRLFQCLFTLIFSRYIVIYAHHSVSLLITNEHMSYFQAWNFRFIAAVNTYEL